MTLVDNFMKELLLKKTGRAIGFGLFLFGLFSCGNKNAQLEKHAFNGNAQGSTYGIIYYSTNNVAQKEVEASVEHSLQYMDDLFSLWQDSSALNRLNASKRLKLTGQSAKHFERVLHLSDSIYMLSDSLYDVSILPLVKKWGFGKNVLDTLLDIDSAHALVDFSKVHWEYSNDVLSVELGDGQSLDFNSIAQGYTVDVLAEDLERFGITSYLIEVGGEMKLGKKKPNGSLWSVGIDKPIETGERELVDTLYLENAAVATSGSYRKFYVKNGKKYSHSIHPKTGRPVEHNTVSTTVVSKSGDCAMADGLATAIMIMGSETYAKFLTDSVHYDVMTIDADTSGFEIDWK
jgi:thiamine biosynthesis lipoprotein